MFKFFTGIFFVATSTCAWAQFNLEGIVTDSARRQPLPGATVRLSQPSLVTITDAFGYFRFQNLASRSYEVTVSFVGYESFSRTISLDENKSVKIALASSAIITDAVVVNATRATDKTPATFSDVSKEAIQKQNFGQDVPFLINWTPSVVTTSDAGTGVGYTGIRIRGSDATQINVTINGIPYNDSESLGTFWVDVPDIASSTQNIQIQRGVGTSTNGAGAFGATINLQTNEKRDEPYAEILNSGGTFATRRHTFGFGTGLLNERWVIEGRVSKIKSDGFIDRASSDLVSHYFSAGYFSGKTILKAIHFGGKERTYQSWYGVPESRLNNDVEAMETTAINEYWNDEQTDNLFNSNSRTFNSYIYENQVDDYRQDHFQLHFSHQLSSDLIWNTSLHYTKGRGFFEEYKFEDAFSNYGISPVTIGDSLVESSDIVRRRWLDNDFYGFTYSFNYEKGNLSAIVGGGWNRYDGDHFGEVTWAEVATVPTGFRYYFNNGDKRDFNSFAKINYQFAAKLNGFVDLQVRKLSYIASGADNDQFPFEIDADYTFFNPKAGLTYSPDEKSQVYAFAGIGNREPVREDFIAADEEPKHETMTNFEIGYKRRSTNYFFAVNYYLMNYENQLVLTGELNDVGAPIRENAGKSYRTGVEIDGGVKLNRNLTWNANVAFSRNKIESYVEVLEDYGTNFDEFNIVLSEYKDTDISFSPKIIAGSQLLLKPFANAEVGLLTKYVGEQFLDNTSNDQRTIDSYLVNDVRLSYAWKPSFVKEITFSLLINNILDEEYESNGYTWGFLAGAAAYRENYYYPQAGRNFLAMIGIRL